MFPLHLKTEEDTKMESWIKRNKTDIYFLGTQQLVENLIL